MVFRSAQFKLFLERLILETLFMAVKKVSFRLQYSICSEGTKLITTCSRVMQDIAIKQRHVMQTKCNETEEGNSSDVLR